MYACVCIIDARAIQIVVRVEGFICNPTIPHHISTFLYSSSFVISFVALRADQESARNSNKKKYEIVLFFVFLLDCPLSRHHLSAKERNTIECSVFFFNYSP